MPIVVFVGVLEHGHEDDQGKGRRHDRLAIRDRYLLDCLHVAEQQEIRVGCLTSKLYEQIQRQEARCRVLGCLDPVVAELPAVLVLDLTPKRHLDVAEGSLFTLAASAIEAIHFLC